MKLALVLATVAGTTILAAGEFRIDLISMKSNIDLEIRETSGKFKIIDSPWYKEKRKQSIEIRGETFDQWKTYSITFVPEKSGEVFLKVNAPYVKPGEKPKVCAYDNFKVKGAELKNGGFEEKVPAHGWIPGWGTKDGLMTGDAPVRKVLYARDQPESHRAESELQGKCSRDGHFHGKKRSLVTDGDIP